MKPFAFFLLLAVISLSLILVGSGKKVVGETPCVDGYKRLNLEGIMCEEIEETWFGMHWGFASISLLPILFGLILLGRRIFTNSFWTYSSREENIR